MAKKTSTGRVVDIAALSRIGRSRTSPSQLENKNMDKFLQFAGTIAIDLFAKSFAKKQELIKTNDQLMDDFKLTNSEVYDNSPAFEGFVKKQQDDINQATKSTEGLFGSNVTSLISPDKSKNARDVKFNAVKAIDNLDKNTQKYTADVEKNLNIAASGFVKDPDGKYISTGFDTQNLPDDLLFALHYGNRDLDKFLVIKEDGSLHLPTALIDNIDKLQDIQQKMKESPEFAAQFDPTKTKLELTPMKDWPKPVLDKSASFNKAMSKTQGIAVQFGQSKAYDGASKSYYIDDLRASVNNMSGEELLSGFFTHTLNYNEDGSRAGVGRTVSDAFIDNPGFDVIIDHDGDPNTKKAVFDGTQKYIERTFGKNKTEETLTKEEAGQLAIWKQGVTNELKTALNPNDPNLAEYLINIGDQQAAIRQNIQFDSMPIENKPLTAAQQKRQDEQQRASQLLKSFETGEKFYLDDDLKKYAITNPKTGRTTIYNRVEDKGTAESDDPKYKIIKQQEIFSGDLYDALYQTEFPIKGLPKGTPLTKDDIFKSIENEIKRGQTDAQGGLFGDIAIKQ
jgi:hypothetical protein